MAKQRDERHAIINMNRKHKHTKFSLVLTVAPGDFSLAKLPIISSYSLRCRVLVCMDLVTHHKKRYKCTHYTPVLREIFCLPCWLTLSCKLMIGTFNVGSPSCIFGGTSDYIFLVRLVLPQSMTSLDVHFSMLFNQGFGMPCGTFWVVTCYRNLCLIA